MKKEIAEIVQTLEEHVEANNKTIKLKHVKKEHRYYLEGMNDGFGRCIRKLQSPSSFPEREPVGFDLHTKENAKANEVKKEKTKTIAEYIYMIQVTHSCRTYLHSDKFKNLPEEVQDEFEKAMKLDESDFNVLAHHLAKLIVLEEETGLQMEPNSI